MTAFLLGMCLFFGTHTVRIVAPTWRQNQIDRLGENAWKGLYSLLTLAGFGLMIWGYGQTRGDAEMWHLPRWTAHLAALLTLPAFILVLAAYVPANHFKARLGHPMLMGTKIWALSHLLVNARLGDVLLFGVFLLWASLAFASSRKRDRLAGKQYPAGKAVNTLAVVALGAAAWAGFAFFAHAWLIGVRPFG